MNPIVDAVITWVDGSERKHANKLKSYLCINSNALLNNEAIHPTRFNQCGELKYCILSIHKFAPWIRTIFIVTDNQTPEILQSLPQDIINKVKIIDHQEIFAGFENNLPTFNSLAIETVLWRINDLAEKFIYFNDDCFLVRPVIYENFFAEDKLILRGSWKVRHDKKINNYIPIFIKNLLANKVKSIDNHRLLQEKSGELTGFKRIFVHLPHIPFPNYKSTYINYFSKFPEKLIDNISYKFRDIKQFWPISLMQHFMIKNYDVIFDNKLKAITINSAVHSKDKVIDRLNQVKNQEKIKFLCLQSLDSTPEKLREYMFDWLDENIS